MTGQSSNAGPNGELLDRTGERYQYGNAMANLTDAVRLALDAVPFASLREVARAAGVSHVLLVKIRHGELSATPEVAARLAVVFEGWARASRDAARGVRRALPRGGKD